MKRIAGTPFSCDLAACQRFLFLAGASLIRISARRPFWSVLVGKDTEGILGGLAIIATVCVAGVVASLAGCPSPASDGNESFGGLLMEIAAVAVAGAVLLYVQHRSRRQS